MVNVLTTEPTLNAKSLQTLLEEIKASADKPVQIHPTRIVMSEEIEAQVRRMAAEAGMTPQEFIDAVLAGAYL